MMRLELTLQEAESLHNTLTRALAHNGTDADEQVLKKLLEKVVEGMTHSTRHARCPVCQQLFTQDVAGRTGIYCSTACKQKAYRQRRNAWRRQVGPYTQT